MLIHTNVRVRNNFVRYLTPKQQYERSAGERSISYDVFSSNFRLLPHMMFSANPLPPNIP